MTFPIAPPSPTRTLWVLIANILCVTCAELFLKTGATASGGDSVLGFSSLQSPYTIVGICFHIAGFGCWMYALRTVPLTLAYNFTAINQVLVPIAARFILRNEPIPPLRWMGIALVVVGFILLVPVLARFEEKAERRPLGGGSASA
jgi:drug/metabolite transporter (DMT)-like permease